MMIGTDKDDLDAVRAVRTEVDLREDVAEVRGVNVTASGERVAETRDGAAVDFRISRRVGDDHS